MFFVYCICDVWEVLLFVACSAVEIRLWCVVIQLVCFSCLLKKYYNHIYSNWSLQARKRSLKRNDIHSASNYILTSYVCFIIELFNMMLARRKIKGFNEIWPITHNFQPLSVLVKMVLPLMINIVVFIFSGWPDMLCSVMCLLIHSCRNGTEEMTSVSYHEIAQNSSQKLAVIVLHNPYSNRLIKEINMCQKSLFFIIHSCGGIKE